MVWWGSKPISRLLVVFPASLSITAQEATMFNNIIMFINNKLRIIIILMNSITPVLNQCCVRKCTQSFGLVITGKVCTVDFF